MVRLRIQCVATPIVSSFEQLVKQHFPVDKKEEASDGTDDVSTGRKYC